MKTFRRLFPALKRAFGIITVSVMIFCCLPIAARAEEARVPAARPSEAGKLHLEGTQLTGENGQKSVLRGVSTHGLTYYPDYVDEALFAHISRDWDVNLVRLAMYSEDYCGRNRKANLKLLKAGIEYAVAADMYVLVDWHILDDGNPNENLAEAIAFFDSIAAEYAEMPNVYFGEPGVFRLGESAALELTAGGTVLQLHVTVVGVKVRRNVSARYVYTVEILDFGGGKDEYVHLLYNRIPTLPQSLGRDFGIIGVLVKNISERI